MREEVNIVEQYADADTSRRIDILIKYYPNFLRLVEGYEQSLAIRYDNLRSNDAEGALMIPLKNMINDVYAKDSGTKVLDSMNQIKLFRLNWTGAKICG